MAALAVAVLVALVIALVALDLGALGDQAADRAAVEEVDRQHVVGGTMRSSRALVAVLGAVVVGVGIARIIAGLPLLTVLQAVAILVPPGLVLVKR